MSDIRRVRNLVKSRPTIEGAGVHLQRAIGLGAPEEYAPFLLLDDFRSDTPAHYLKGFPWHPHRGMETITYVDGRTSAGGRRCAQVLHWTPEYACYKLGDATGSHMDGDDSADSRRGHRERGRATTRRQSGLVPKHLRGL